MKMIWTCEGRPRAIVQILHGMAEHMGRYERMAKALNEKGFLVVGRDLRGHGKDARKLGFFAEKNGWNLLLQDAHDLMCETKKAYPHTPYFLLGHSMGSFLAREFALRYGPELNGLILSGTGFFPKALTRAGKGVASLMPPKKPSKLVDKMAFSGNNKPFRPARTSVDWLSRDEKQVDAYVADPLCGFMFTGRAYADFFGGLYALTDEKRLAKMPKDLPVYFLSGDQDPVGQMGNGVEKVAASFRSAGMKNVTVKLYPGARHELFNEINKEEVDEDLARWLEYALKCTFGKRVLQRAKGFATLPWLAEEKNLFHGEDAMGYRVDTPDAGHTGSQYPCAWWKIGENRGMPYCWGGWSDEQQFLDGLKQGKYAGNVPEDRPRVISRDCVGMDCSGLVSVCWQLPKKLSTRDLGALCDEISYDELQPGDILLKAGSHVMFFSRKMNEGNFETVEATRYGGKVLCKERNLEELKENGYLAYRLKEENKTFA
ncbi:MAG: alpha/beta fold hydrolase [Clostridia bacterium]|nr:alpha/beta fold hydrolase [Clostridia bacterium]